MAGRYAFDAALGIAGAGKGHFLIAKGPKTEDRRHQGTLHRAVPDPENSLRFEALAE